MSVQLLERLWILRGCIAMFFTVLDGLDGFFGHSLITVSLSASSYTGHNGVMVLSGGVMALFGIQYSILRTSRNGIP